MSRGERGVNDEVRNWVKRDKLLRNSRNRYQAQNCSEVGRKVVRRVADWRWSERF